MTINSTDSLKIGSSSQTCSLGSNSQIGTSGACVCKNGYEIVSNKCVACTSSDKNKIGNGTGNGCICKDGFQNMTNRCVACNIVDINRIGNGAGKDCKCKPNYRQSGLFC